MTIRRASHQDVQCLAAFSIEVWLHTHARKGIGPSEAEYVLTAFSPEKIQDMLEDSNQHVWIAFDGEHISGYLHWMEKSQPPNPDCPGSQIIALYVRNPGKREKIGSRLLQVCYRECIDQKVEGLYLALDENDSPAIQFFLRKGFVEAGEDNFTLAGKEHRQLLLAKSL